MSTDRFGAPLPGATYNGFSGPQSAARREAAPPREGLSKKTLYGGLAAAICAGLAFGLWARPEFANDRQAREPMKAAVQAPTEAPLAQVPIEVVQPLPAPAPKADGPLDVLPADLARAAEAARPMAPPPVVVRRPAPAPTPPTQVAVIAPRPQPAVVERARDDANPSFNCRYARSRSEQLVCGDAELASLDRRLAGAFNRAVNAGVPYRELRAEQDDWLNIREDAARRSPDAVASIYRQRIRELNAIADDDF